MANVADIGFEQRLAWFSGLLGLTVTVAGLLVLGGWAFDIPALKSLVPGLVTMKANTAVAFVLGGASLWLLGRPAGAPASRPTAWAARALAAIVGNLGLLTLGEYGFGWNPGIDELLFDDVGPLPGAPFPGRMALMTALNFTLLAAALLLLDVGTRGGRRPSNWLALAIAANSFLAILGYLYGVDALYRVAALTSVALHTAILFVAISLGVVCARPGARFVGQIAADSAAGLINRRLLPAAILIPPFVGWLCRQGERAGYYSTAFGLALFAMSNVAIFATLIWLSARALQRMHEQRSALSRTSDWQQAILNSADFTVISTDTHGVIRTVNAGVVNMLGYTAAELVDRTTPAVLHDPVEVAARAQTLSQELGYTVEPGFDAFVAKVRLGGSDENDWTYIRKDGSRFPARLSVTPLTDASGTLTGFLGIGKDISAQKLAEQALRDSEQAMRLIADQLAASEARLRQITNNLPVLISYIDRERRFRFNNATYAQWLARPLGQITGRLVAEVYDASMCELIQPQIEEAFKGVAVTFEFAAPTAGRVFRATYIPDLNAANEVIGIYGLTYDITVQKEVEAQLRQLAQYDSLTGLANRSRFDDKLAEAIMRSERNGQALALIFLDLDDFKSINDTFGHHGGDLALQEFARRLSGSVRATDTVARLAGDEFVVILELLKHPSEAAKVAAKIVATMETPFQISGVQCAFSTSMGIAVRRPGETDGEALLRRADSALYQAKASGRGRFLVEE